MKTSTRSSSAERKARYKAMASETDKDQRNNQLSTKLGENALVIEENAKLIRERAKVAKQEQERYDRAFEKAKTDKQKAAIVQSFSRRGERLGVSFSPKAVAKLSAVDTAQNRLTKNGTQNAKPTVSGSKHSTANCGNLGCERCFPQYSRRRQDESPKFHQLRREGRA